MVEKAGFVKWKLGPPQPTVKSSTRYRVSDRELKRAQETGSGGRGRTELFNPFLTLKKVTKELINIIPKAEPVE